MSILPQLAQSRLRCLKSGQMIGVRLLVSGYVVRNLTQSNLTPEDYRSRLTM